MFRVSLLLVRTVKNYFAEAMINSSTVYQIDSPLKSCEDVIVNNLLQPVTWIFLYAMMTEALLGENFVPFYICW